MFDGRDYQREFEETCHELVTVKDYDHARRKLVSLEFVLCEAINKALLTFSIIPAGIITVLLFWGAIGVAELSGWGVATYAIGGVLTYLTVGFLIYQVQKLVFWYEVSRHIVGRKFGSLKLLVE